MGKMHNEKQSCDNVLNLGNWFGRCRLKDFLSGALPTILRVGAEPFMQVLKGT